MIWATPREAKPGKTLRTYDRREWEQIMELMDKLNSPFMYMLCGGIIAFIAAVCVIFIVRAYRTGIAMGMEKEKLNRVIISSASFTVLPALAILLGVIALSGSLGVPWPWLRLSVIGALHYETQVASAAAEATGMSSLSAAEMTAGSFSTICLLMSVCIIWGPLLCVILNKKYSGRLNATDEKGEKKDNIFARGFGDLAITAMFIGLVSAYIGSYIGGIVSGNGLFTFSGNWLPLAVAIVAAIAMAGFLWLREKKDMVWVESFSVCGSMLIAMAAAIILAPLV